MALYRNDITKYTGKAAPKIIRIFDNIPGSFQSPEKKFRSSEIKKEARMKDMGSALFLLEESRVAYISSLFNMVKPNGRWRIIKESDLLTDKNM